MREFIELRFGQGRGEVQRELVPIKQIKNAYVILPEKRNIRISFEDGNGKIRRRTEYYKNEIDCIKRWTFIKLSCGLRGNDCFINPVPLAEDAEAKSNREEV